MKVSSKIRTTGEEDKVSNRHITPARLGMGSWPGVRHSDGAVLEATWVNGEVDGPWLTASKFVCEIDYVRVPASSGIVRRSDGSV